MKRKFLLSLALTSLSLLGTSSNLYAHFPWLIRTEDGKAALFFGESLTDRTYKLPKSIAEAQIKLVDDEGKPTSLEVVPTESEQFVGLISKSPTPIDQCLTTQVTFGIYQGMKLTYYASNFGKLAESLPATSIETDLSVIPTNTATGVDVMVYWKGKPLPNAEVTLFCDEGEEEGKATTDASGKVSFTDEQVEPGLNALMVGYQVEAAGSFNEKTYTKESHYATVTFNDPEVAIATDKETDEPAIAALPFPITSFGAATIGTKLYVYGGHTGDAHAYVNEDQNDKLLVLDLASEKPEWTELSTNEKLQGLGMVAYKNEVIILGGFTAMNKKGEKQNLKSQTYVRAFDVDKKSWRDLPALPEPRSSHDAALIGSTIYVVGGWNMQGNGEDTDWHTTAWSMDLAAANPQWKKISDPPFTRRAVATVAHDDKLFVIGGMNENDGPTKDAEIYDPQSNTWHDAASIIGEKAMAGFGAAGWSINGTLFITSHEGDVERWDADKKNWVAVGKTKEARFFNRLLPVNGKQLISIGGANMEVGKYTEVELIDLE
jgi:N-acetylneuraminic acid mutarotase